MNIGIDVMGGDYAPKEIIDGAILAQEKLPATDTIALIGNQALILPYLSEQGIDPGLFEIIHASEIIQMGEQPIRAFTNKQNSSISIGFKMLNAKRIDSFAGVGNTGAMLVGSVYTMGAVQGIIRPCTTAVLPKVNGGVNILLDVGTVPDCRPDLLYQFAIVGSLYARYVYNVKNPRVALLNIGEEDEKGNLLSQSAYRLMKDSVDFNFVGNIEGREILRDSADVIVCDGFTGNVVLKQIESFHDIICERKIKDEYFDRLNYENYGGTPILGISGTVLIGHGISNANAIKNMLLLSKTVHEAKLSTKIKSALNRFSKLLKNNNL